MIVVYGLGGYNQLWTLSVCLLDLAFAWDCGVVGRTLSLFMVLGHIYCADGLGVKRLMGVLVDFGVENFTISGQKVVQVTDLVRL